MLPLILFDLHWIKIIDDHEELRNKSIKGLQFPFDNYLELTMQKNIKDWL
jgi:hypothetical protein